MRELLHPRSQTDPIWFDLMSDLKIRRGRYRDFSRDAGCYIGPCRFRRRWQVRLSLLHPFILTLRHASPFASPSPSALLPPPVPSAALPPFVRPSASFLFPLHNYSFRLSAIDSQRKPRPNLLPSISIGAQPKCTRRHSSIPDDRRPIWWDCNHCSKLYLLYEIKL